jgi:alkylhydroperoxidase/carboxymuconolactone decarboxylase family protein YurZ
MDCPFHSANEGDAMKIRKKILDFEYEEVLDAKTRELIRVGCAVAVGCPT